MPHRWRTVLAVAGLPRVAVRQPPTRLERHHLGLGLGLGLGLA